MSTLASVSNTDSVWGTVVHKAVNLNLLFTWMQGNWGHVQHILSQTRTCNKSSDQKQNGDTYGNNG